MSAVIRVDKLSKRYWIQHGSGRAQYGTLREELVRVASAPFRRVLRSVRGGGAAPKVSATEEFWALKDVSFEVGQGQVVGIIGRNGAGKSTLLKVLSRITEPTTGRVEITGRVASLLEVGTGFHPELSGRENIFLNGAILGMSRAEIRSKFDEIVAFAEVERFIETPVKRYSSGMYVRLAFAVAAHLDPEILVVDEVLAVGDAQFQRKCLGKIRDVSTQQGRTVLFVSHQMGTIRQLCTSAILLQNGQIATQGEVEPVINAYLGSQLGGGSGYSAGGAAMKSDMPIVSAWTTNAAGEPTTHFMHTDPISVCITCRINKWTPNAELRLAVGDGRGRRVFTSDVDLPRPASDADQTIEAVAKIPAHFLRPETYFVTLATFVNNQVIFDLVHDGFSFTVQDAGSKFAASEGLDYGCVFVNCEWTVNLGAKPDASRPALAVTRA